MQTKLKPLVAALAFALAANQHMVWAADENNVVAQDTKLPAENKSADDTAVTEMPLIQVRGVADTGYMVKKATVATKTDTPILETPMAVQVIPQEVLNDRQIVSIQEAVKNVSGVQTPTSLFYDTTMIRGFAVGGIFRDGLKSQGLTGTEDMAFVDHVEIAKGPTSMLYGRVQPGGLVNIVTKKPQAQSAFSVQQQVGSWNTYRTTADATGAVNADKSVLYRVMGSYDKGDSFVDFQHHDNKALAAYLSWLPSAQFESNLQFEYYDNKDAGRGNYWQQIPVVGNRPLNVPQNWTQSDPVMWGSFPDTAKRKMLAFDWSYKFSDAWKVTHRFQYNNTDEVQTYLLASGYNAATQLYPRKLVSTPFLRNSYSTNLDLTGEFKAGAVKHNLLLGLDAYWHREDTTGYNPSPYGSVPTVNALNVFAPVYGNIDPTVIQPLIDASASNILWRSVYRDVGIYAQDQITFDEHWELLLGGRYDQAENKSSVVYGQTNAACYPNCTGDFQTNAPTETQFSPRAGLLYKLSSEVSLYGSYSESFGNSNPTSLSFTQTPFDPERGIQYETGAKASLLGGKVSTSATLFDLRLRNRLTPDLANPGFMLAVGEVRSKGLEFDLSGQVTNHISLIGSYTYDNVTITKDNTAGTANTVGNVWAGVPTHNVSFWSKYDTAPGAAEGIAFGAGLYLNGERQANNANTAQLPGYGRLDAMIGYRTKIGKDKVTAQLNVQNLTDQVYYENGSGTALYGNPRNLMASVKVDL